jgi:hypothetical protein
MNRSDFFKQIVDDYLFLDLRNMAKLEQKDGEGGGAASYPIVDEVRTLLVLDFEL